MLPNLRSRARAIDGNQSDRVFSAREPQMLSFFFLREEDEATSDVHCGTSTGTKDQCPKDLQRRYLALKAEQFQLETDGLSGPLVTPMVAQDTK